MASISKANANPSRIRETRRRQLVEAAVACIAERGLPGATLSAVTAKAGLSHGLANFHFESKDALLSETLGHLAEEHHAEWRRALDAAPADPASRLAALVAADFAPSVCTPERLAVWFAFWGQATHRPYYLEKHRQYDGARKAMLQTLCADLAAVPVQGARPAMDPDRAARSIEALVDGLWLQLLLDPAAIDRKEAHACARDGLAALFPMHFPPAT